MTTKPRSLLLPSDVYLAELLGLTEEQLIEFKSEVRKRNETAPTPSVVCSVETLAIISLVSSVISVGLSIAASFFKPKGPAEVRTRQYQGQSKTENTRFAPRFGFESVQDVATLGSPIPLIYTFRETLDGKPFGGMRVNNQLLWSQVYSLGGSQMLRAIFMLGQGPVSDVDIRGFAIGNNGITNYDFENVGVNTNASRISIYFRPDGGRILSGDSIFGRSGVEDLGNAQNDGGGDVFMLRSVGNNYAGDFSYSSKPSTSTSFGLYSTLGNNLGFKLNPNVRPAFTPRLKGRGSSGNSTLKCDKDKTVEVQRQKFSTFFSSRSGVVSGSFNTGGTFTYRLDRSSDYETVFQSVEDETKVWTSSVEVASVPFIYQRDSSTRITGWNFDTLMSITGVSVTNDTLTVTATWDSESVLTKIINSDAANGQYKVIYSIQVSDGDEEIESDFEITISIQGKRKFEASNNTSGSTFKEYSLTTTSNVDGLVTSVSLPSSGNNSVVVQTTITENNSEYTRYVTFDGAVDSDSGPVQLLTSPLRLRSNIVFPVKDIEAYTEKAADAAAAIAGRQATWDDALVVGDLYKCGSAWAVCTEKRPGDARFLSDSTDFSVGTGLTVEADFTVVKGGSSATVSLADIQADGDADPPVSRQTATSGPHLHKMALANVTTNTECKIVEIGFRSSLGIRYNSICNFRDTLTLEETDSQACLLREGDNIKRGQKINVAVYQSGVINAPEERYSFFRVYYRKAGVDSAFTRITSCFGIRSTTQQAAFNYLRLQLPSAARWEFRIEPLSGWEIRNNIATGTLAVLDAKLSSLITRTEDSITWHSNGEIVARVRSRFLLDATERADPGMGFPRPDNKNYVDDWGKLAEAFVYEEVQSSTGQSPEHEVVYLNEIKENIAIPQYNNIALIGINVLSSVEWQQFSQFSTYVKAGLTCRRLRNNLSPGPTHLFPDILLDLLTNTEYGAGSLITDDMIDLTSFQEAADWCFTRRYFYDGIKVERINLRQWAADTAATHLLEFGEKDGKFYLRPNLPLSAVAIKGLFTAGNIVENSFQMRYLDPEDRETIRVSVRYREERSNTDIDNPGLFALTREVLVRETLATAENRVEQIDVSDFCTTRQHAIDAAKYIIRLRRIPTHVCSFTTTHEAVLTNIGPGDYIRIALDSTQYDEFNNGVVTNTGALSSTKALANGTYAVIAWDGSSTPPNDTNLVVINDGKTATPTGVVFTVKNVSSQVRTYQIESIQPNEDGSFQIECVHMPTLADGMLEISSGFDTPSNWIIEG